MMRDPFADPAPLVRRVYAYVAYRVADRADAEDITSETFERALRYRESFDHQRGDVTAWLIGIARRCIADAFTLAPVPATELAEVATDGPEESTSLRLDVRAALQELDDRDQELIALRYGGDLTARQIGELLGLKTNTVEVGLHRALARLRKVIDSRPAEDPAAFRPVRAQARL